MKTYLTIADLMLRLRIPQSQYHNFRIWCFKHKDQLDTQQCKWNNGYLLYNVDLVRLKCPYTAVENADKVSTPEHTETPLDAAERLAAAINTATGKNLTGAEVLEHCNRMYDYIRMRRTMARVLWRMRKERRKCEMQVRDCNWHLAECYHFRSDCYNTLDKCDQRLRSMDKELNFEKLSVFGFAVAVVVLFGALLLKACGLL